MSVPFDNMSGLVPTGFTTTFRGSMVIKPAKAGKEACFGLLRYATKKRQAIPMTWRTLRKEVPCIHRDR